MNIQWYPGHMTKAKRMMQENIKLIDVVVELLDARVPLASRNPDIDTLAGQKYRLVILNKSDLADANVTAMWEQYFKAQGVLTLTVNARDGKGMQSVTKKIQDACREKMERDRRRGILNRPLRAMIVGIPNVGKSTFINSYTGKACTKVGNQPGVTKGKQWIRMNRNVELLDTPGILWPKFEDAAVGEHLAYIGSINDDIIQRTELACRLLTFLSDAYPNAVSERYGIESSPDPAVTLSAIAQSRGCVMKGQETDYEKAAGILLEDFRSGRLGRISVERPPSGGTDAVQKG